MPALPSFASVFPSPPVIGVVHLLPLPGSPRPAPMDDVLRRATADTRTWFRAGADAVIVENFGDAPFHPDAVPGVTIAAMARVLSAVNEEAAGPLGVNVLRNDADAALSLASTFDLAFLRVNVHAGAMVTDQGLIEGHAHRTLRRRAELPGHPLILADVQVKHARPVSERRIEEEGRELYERAAADAVLITGSSTGHPADSDDLDRLRAVLPDAPLLLASGVDPDRIRATRGLASGWIVGTYGKVGGRTLGRPSAARIAHLVAAGRGRGR